MNTARDQSTGRPPSGKPLRTKKRVGSTARRFAYLPGRVKAAVSGRRLAGPQLVKAFNAVYPEAFFVEIGANDGQHDDFLSSTIRSGRWSGLMVEPVPHVFERLRRNYQQFPKVQLENAAIADLDGELPFWYLRPVADPEAEGLPGHYDELGSFKREVLMSHAYQIPDIPSRIVQTMVPCMTYRSLCAKHSIQGVDLVLIDTEGYDYEIVQRLEFAPHGPRMLVYEHYHLSPSERSECQALLQREGYETMEERYDTWCVRTAVDDQLTRTWRRVTPAIPGLSAYDSSLTSAGRDR